MVDVMYGIFTYIYQHVPEQNQLLSVALSNKLPPIFTKISSTDVSDWLWLPTSY